MKMTPLCKMYIDNPHNFLICGKGGFGKTTQLRIFQSQIYKKLITFEGKEQVCIPILINLAEANKIRGNIDNEFLYKKLFRFFNNRVVETKQIKRMLQDERYRFVFILDAENEVICNHHDGDYVLSCLIDNIRDLLDNYPNTVNVIISSRSERLMEDDTFSTFRIYSLDGISEETIKQYIGCDENEIVGYDSYKSLLSCPMLLMMFKRILDENSCVKIEDKADIVYQYLQIDTDFRNNGRFRDGYILIRKCVVENILPFIAFEHKKLELQCGNIDDEVLIKDAVSNVGQGYDINDVMIVLDMMRIYSSVSGFSHQLFCEYFAAREMNNRSIRENEKVLSAVTRSVSYNNRQDFGKRMNQIDFAEFIYSIYGSRMSILGDDFVVEDFVQELAGLYEDLKERELASNIGLDAYERLSKLPREQMDDYLERLNFVGYCLLGSEKNSELAKDIFKHIYDQLKYLEYEKNIPMARLMGKVLNNMGAYYYKHQDYCQSLMWHIESLEYRKQYDFEFAMASYKSVMSDYFKLRKYREAYEVYEEFEEFVSKYRIECDIFDITERAIGVEIEMLQLERDDVEKASFRIRIENQAKKLVSAIENEKAKRVYRDGLKSLIGKLQFIRNYYNMREEEEIFCNHIWKIENRIKELI